MGADNPFAVVPVVGDLQGFRFVVFGRRRNDDILYVFVEDCGSRKAFRRFDGAFTARFRRIVFAHAQQHIFSA